MTQAKQSPGFPGRFTTRLDELPEQDKEALVGDPLADSLK
jgi:hypothetical protein